ncbi:uncharacterized protein A1O9_09886 [Exophiala aquamarina CBS 119918]|uniref:Prefoldin, alpha subunit n=1 Tax=Exophiala aquamarina CBS 119918 TaxID=1182545 RepID=A0A072P2K8_9EURO|nr:uncharacterized protein A1O9_09886 [Exophiala aquamarina CBS 119918]KEF54091.1 hypothetical protein A1O9_09886 [Exophiala aquamarina CBS 119918]
MSQSPQNTVDLNTLPAQQLSALQQRLSQELEHLSTSYQRLCAAQSRFRDCIRSIQDGIQGKSGETPLLIPLTTSLYVPGRLANPSASPSDSSPTPKAKGAGTTATVLVDVGTGFYVEKSTADAVKFYSDKINDLSRNLGDIEKVVAGKNDNLKAVEDVLRQKMLTEGSGGPRPGQALQTSAG